MSARAYDNIMDKCHFEDYFPPMLDLDMRLFYSFNKLRSWFCISHVEDTKTEHFTWKRKFWRLLYEPVKIMLLMYIL